MLRDSGKGNVVGRGQLGDGGLALGEPRQDATPCRVSERGEGEVESRA
jgi:hypothetical protein